MSDTHGNQVSPGEETDRITVRVPEGLLAEFETAVDLGHYTTLSEAVRESMRETIRDRRDWR